MSVHITFKLLHVNSVKEAGNKKTVPKFSSLREETIRVECLPALRNLKNEGGKTPLLVKSIRDIYVEGAPVLGVPSKYLQNIHRDATL